MTTQLAQYLSARTDIDAQTTAYIANHLRPLTTKRNAFLLTPGEVCKHYYFVNKGCLRLFSVNDTGEEGTRHFAFEGSFGTALPSLIDQQPAFEFIQAIGSISPTWRRRLRRRTRLTLTSPLLFT